MIEVLLNVYKAVHMYSVTRNPIDLNSLNWVIYVFGSKSNRTEPIKIFHGWVMSLDL